MDISPVTEWWEAIVKLAVLIPCFNEEQTVGKVVDDFRRELQDAQIYVYDNNSADGTALIAQKHGAIVRREVRQGKGHVVRSMFRDIDADVYIMVDGDDTYPAEAVHDLISSITQGTADMVVGNRQAEGAYASENKRAFHTFGNTLVRRIINFLFNGSLNDVMSGYRAFNERFVRSIPITSPGFEVETEMTLNALDKGCVIAEVPVAYRDRPAGSSSKLNTFRDGAKVLTAIVRIFKDYRPMLFFGYLSLLLFVVGLAIGLPVVADYAHTGLVPRLPSAVLALGIELLAAIALTCGLILQTMSRHFREIYEITTRR